MAVVGDKLQEEGRQLIEKMGLTCLTNLGNIPLQQIAPTSSVGSGEHLEFDYLVPIGRVCLIGEITGRSIPQDVRDKYDKFKNQYNFFVTSQNPNKFDTFNIPDSMRHLFSLVDTYRGFFISTRLQIRDLNLGALQNIAIHYRNDWDMLRYFADCIFENAQFPFLEKFNLNVGEMQAAAPGTAEPSLAIQQPHRETERVISEGTAPADVYVFRESPANLLPIAKVFRRDELPDLSPTELGGKYQRPLDRSKLCSIRSIIHDKPNFMFPNSIIAVLSADSFYREDDSSLHIPQKYGSLTIVDGQHRLFSYAGSSLAGATTNSEKCPMVPDSVRQAAKVLVMAIRFRDSNEQNSVEYAAKTFIEINRNHTRIPQRHLYLIEYDVLGSTTGPALASKVMLNCNTSQGAGQGLFKTNQMSTGRLPVVTIIEELGHILDIEGRISKCTGTETKGFEELLGQTLSTLEQPDALITAATGAMKHYLNLLHNTFAKDWPSSASVKSGLRRAKFFAAFIRLYDTMLKEGQNWQGVQDSLIAIRANILKLRGMPSYDEVLFAEDVPDIIPTWRDTIRDLHEFLDQNRNKPWKKPTIK